MEPRRVITEKRDFRLEMESKCISAPRSVNPNAVHTTEPNCSQYSSPNVLSIHLPAQSPACRGYIAGGHQISDAACFDHVRPARTPSRIRYSKKQKNKTRIHTGRLEDTAPAGRALIHRTGHDAMSNRCTCTAGRGLAGGWTHEGRKKNPMRRWRTAARGYTRRLRVQHQDDTK